MNRVKEVRKQFWKWYTQKKKQRGERMLKELAWNRFYAPRKNVRGQVIVLHGYREGSESLMPLIHALVNQGFNVVSADYLGHGQSNGRRGYFRRLEDAVFVCRALAVYLRRKSDGRKLPTFAIGYSTGALAILWFLLRHPFAYRLISGAVLISTPLEVTQNSSRLAQSFKPILGVFTATLGWMRVPKIFMEKSARKENGGGLQEHNPLCYRGRPFFRFAIEMFRKSREVRERVQREIHLPTPLCVIHGTKDTRAEYETAREVFTNMEHVDFYPLEDVGHYVWGEAPQYVTGIIVDWLRAQTAHSNTKKKRRWWQFM